MFRSVLKHADISRQVILHMVIGKLSTCQRSWLLIKRTADTPFSNLQRLPRSYPVEFSPSVVSATHLLPFAVRPPPHSLMLFCANTVCMSNMLTVM